MSLPRYDQILIYDISYMIYDISYNYKEAIRYVR